MGGFSEWMWGVGWEREEDSVDIVRWGGVMRRYGGMRWGCGDSVNIVGWGGGVKKNVCSILRCMSGPHPLCPKGLKHYTAIHSYRT